MTAYLTDKQLRSITPEAAEAYLRAHGWHNEENALYRVSRWTRAGSTKSVWVHHDTDRIYYPMRVTEMLEEIAMGEGRCSCHVYEDIMSAAQRLKDEEEARAWPPGPWRRPAYGHSSECTPPAERKEATNLFNWDCVYACPALMSWSESSSPVRFLEELAAKARAALSGAEEMGIRPVGRDGGVGCGR